MKMTRVFVLFVLLPTIILLVTETKGVTSEKDSSDYVGYASDYDKFYLSSNGTDVSTCGKTKYTACKTLEHVLSLYYNTTHPPEKGLEIITSKSLIIDGPLMIKYSTFASSNLKISSWDNISFPLSIPLISIINIDFLQSYWEIKNLNIHMDNSNGSLLILYAYATSLKDNSKASLINITINNCIFGYWRLHNFLDVFITNCHKMNTALTTDFPTVTFDNCRASLENVSVGNVQFPKSTSAYAILVYMNSFVTLRKSQFSNNQVYFGLITVMANSTLEMEDCQVWNNQAKHVVPSIVVNNGTLNVTKTIFRNNSADLGGVMIVTNNSALNIYEGIFEDNRGKSWGGCIYSDCLVKIFVYGSNFSSNRVSAGVGGVFFLKHHSSANIVNSNFINNFAFRDAGVVHVYFHSTLNITNTRFSRNKAGITGGVIRSEKHVFIQIHNSVFNNNSAGGTPSPIDKTGGAISQMNNTDIVITNSSFIQNSAASYAAAIDSYFYCNLTIESCVFHGNRQGVISGSLNAQISIINSTFESNSASSNGGVFFLATCLLKISNSSFNENTAGLSGAVMDVEQSEVICYNCLLSNNVAKYQGGTLLTTTSDISFYNSTFVNNTAQTSLGDVFHITRGDLTISDSTLSQNQAGDGGAMYVLQAHQIHINNSHFEGNSAVGEGGAILISNSHLQITNTTFTNNSANNGGVIKAQVRCTITMSETRFKQNKALFGSGGVLFGTQNVSMHLYDAHLINNSAARDGGGVFVDGNSILEVINVTISNNSARVGGAISLSANNTLFVQNCHLEFNFGIIGGAVNLLEGEAFFENCTFTENNALTRGGAIYIQDTSVKISTSTFSSNMASQGFGIHIYCKISPTRNFILGTYASAFGQENITIYSSNKNFTDDALHKNFIESNPGGKLDIEESPYSSVVPRTCYYGCTCFHSPWDNANIFKCEANNLTSLPETALNDTNWLIVTENYLGRITETEWYMNEIVHLDLHSSNLRSISNTAMSRILNNTQYLNIANNSLKNLPKAIAKTHNINELWISNNSYDCNCGMTWMRDRLVEAKNVNDKEKVICATGKMKGKAIYKLDAKIMGCIFPLWGIITIAVGTVFLIVVIVMVHRKWAKLKFYMFVHFNVLTKDDGPENLNEMDFDGYITYSHLDRAFVKAEVIEYLENEYGLTLCIHERDFQPGAAITANIAAAIEHSRRMVMVISRNYVNSGWCMEEFRIAHEQVVSGRKNFLIPLLYEEINLDDLDKDLKMYIETHTYIDSKDLVMLKKRLRFAMPHVPLAKHRQAAQDQDEAGQNRTAAYGISHVGTMAKRIAGGNKKKIHKPPPEGAWGGDIETSESEDEPTPLMN